MSHTRITRLKMQFVTALRRLLRCLHHRTTRRSSEPMVRSLVGHTSFLGPQIREMSRRELLEWEAENRRKQSGPRWLDRRPKPWNQ